MATLDAGWIGAIEDYFERGFNSMSAEGPFLSADSFHEREMPILKRI
ncbi:hypothetical protein M3193_16445 [Sporosarcina luteola]|nr:hypothetical protein [Sporosarcina luteola]MCM3745716.1 hypothetical protein [Sporosarcina luteola]